MQPFSLFRLAPLVLALSLASPAAAAERVRDYAECLAAIDANAETGREAAAEWRQFGGGIPAGLCEALALEALGATGSAAGLLDELALEAVTIAAARQAVEMRAHAADLWLSERAPERALTSLAAALDLAPGDPALLAARAQAHGVMGDWTMARRDLDAALQAAPGAPALLAMRAETRRRTGDAAGALADADAALAGDPADRRALLEKGRAEAALGRRDAAREIFLDVVARDREGPDGEAARLELQRLDGG